MTGEGKDREQPEELEDLSPRLGEDDESTDAVKGGRLPSPPSPPEVRHQG